MAAFACSSAGEKPTFVTADLVVDAGGRLRGRPSGSSRSATAPAVEEVNVGIGYTTRIFRRLPHDLDGDMGVCWRRSRRTSSASASCWRWRTTAGWCRSAAGWAITRRRSRRVPRVRAHAPASGHLRRHQARGAADARRHLRVSIEPAPPLRALARFPGNYLVMGDALCSFNPALRAGHERRDTGVAGARGTASSRRPARRPLAGFFKAAGKIIEGPWMIAAGSDFAFEGVTGAKPRGTSAVNWYLDRVHRAASTDRRVCRAFFEWPTC